MNANSETKKLTPEECFEEICRAAAILRGYSKQYAAFPSVARLLMGAGHLILSHAVTPVSITARRQMTRKLMRGLNNPNNKNQRNKK